MNALTELIQKNTACSFSEQAVFHIKIIKLLVFHNTVAVGAEEH